ncbi:unnamed protein product [Urochloa humidicola]
MALSEPTGQQQHLYLIFDDWKWGYSIREITLPHEHRPDDQHLPLPPPCVCLEATRRLPSYFAAVGTAIIAVHPRNDSWNAPVPECIMPIFDVRSRCVRFGPGLLYPGQSILITVGHEVFALDYATFRVLSMKPECPPHQWSWCDDLPPPPLRSTDVTSIAVVGSDGGTIFASTDCATFVFNIVNGEWKQSSTCSLPFVGLVHYVRALDIFVGISKDPDTYGHLCFCRELSDGGENVRLGKEYLLSEDPAESHVCATLVYLGGSEPAGFCLVDCVCITEGRYDVNNMRLEEYCCDELVKCVDQGGGNCGEQLDQLEKNVDEGDGNSGELLDQLKKNVDEGDGASGSMHHRYIYRLTTFSLSFDNNGDLTTGETCVVQCYKVPEEVSEAIYQRNPVAFWL